jgi:hypothetical protein
MSSQYSSHAKDLEHFQGDLSLIRDSIIRIAKILHEGNGEKPLTSRVSILEKAAELYQKNLEDTEEWMTTRLNRLEEREEARTRAAIEAINIGKAGRWKLIAAVITGMAALATSLLSVLGIV